MKVKFNLTTFFIGIVSILLLLILSGCNNNQTLGESKYDGFAKCLTEQNFVFYGAYWCGHCESQKDMFEHSAFMPYVECSLPNRGGQTQECQDAGIEAYPTWKFPDGSKQSGVIPLSELSRVSGCSLE